MRLNSTISVCNSFFFSFLSTRHTIDSFTRKKLLCSEKKMKYVFTIIAKRHFFALSWWWNECIVYFILRTRFAMFPYNSLLLYHTHTNKNINPQTLCQVMKENSHSHSHIYDYNRVIFCSFLWSIVCLNVVFLFLIRGVIDVKIILYGNGISEWESSTYPEMARS